MHLHWALWVLLGFCAVTLAWPTTRRIWTFFFFLTYRLPAILGNTPRGLRLLCEDMGPTFLKLGQVIASSPGLFPDRYTNEFQRCLDRVRPFDFERVRATIDEELGARASELEELDPKPLASASIAQVHTARLPDGSSIVVKVQRPGIAARIHADMRILRFAARWIQRIVRDVELANPVGIIEDLSVTLNEELDFRKEAENLDSFNRIMGELGHKEIRAPRPRWEYTTVRVLVMERFSGTRVDDVATIRQRGFDAEGKLVLGMRAWFQCVVFYGFFHGDVHAGNLMLLDNEDIGFLDFGIVGRFDERQRRLVTDYLIAFSTGNYRQLANVIRDMGAVLAEVDMDAWVADLERVYKPILARSVSELKYAELLPQINRISVRHRVQMPREFVLITKQMLYFDRYAKALAPNLNVFMDPRLLMSLMQDIQKARMQQPS